MKNVPAEFIEKSLKFYPYNPANESLFIDMYEFFQKNYQKSYAFFLKWGGIEIFRKYNTTILYPKQGINEQYAKAGPRSKYYWMSLGYDEKTSIEIVSIKQSEQSPRSKLYWIKQGLSEQEALIKVTEHQTKIANMGDHDSRVDVMNKNFKTKQFWLNLDPNDKFASDKGNPQKKEFWISRGYTKKQAIEKIEDAKQRISIKAIERNKSIDYKIKRFERYKEKVGRLNINHLSSKEEDIFFDFLSQNNEYFNNLIIKHIPYGVQYKNEFGEYCYKIADGTARRNNERILIEYDGLYWHNEEIDSIKDNLILAPQKRTDIIGIIRISDKYYKSSDKNNTLQEIKNAIEKIFNKEEKIIKLY
jgi:hypothetical protein